MRILYTKDYEEMSRRAANLISAQLLQKPDSVLGLATGSTPLGIYRRLAEQYRQGDLDFSACRVVNLDEYVGLTKDSPQSYAWFMRENLFRQVNISMANTHIPDGANPDAQEECARYDRLIRELGGVDLQLLGIGHNGHIGFNEPAPYFEKATHCVTLTQKTIDANTRFFARKEDVPTRAYTMGIQSIMGARRVLLAASGEEKAEILWRMAAGEIQPGVPASILQLHPNVTVVADAAALSVLAAKAPQLLEGLPASR